MQIKSALIANLIANSASNRHASAINQHASARISTHQHASAGIGRRAELRSILCAQRIKRGGYGGTGPLFITGYKYIYSP